MRLKVFLLVTFTGIALILLSCATPSATPTPAPTKPPTTTAAPSPTVAAPIATPTPQIQRGGTLKAAKYCSPGALHVFKGLVCAPETFLLYDALLAFDEKGNLYPELAEKWDIAPDGKSITIRLRPGVKFHDGTDVNAAAVKFNIETIIKEKGSLAPQLTDVSSVEVIDNLTAKLVLKTPSAPLLTSLAEQPGFIASPAAAEKYSLNDLGRNPVGAGPFQFEEWMQDNRVTVKRFDGYWDKDKVYLDKITFQVIPDASVRTINLKTGSVDWISEVYPKDMVTLKESKDITTYRMYGVGFWRIHLQNTKPPFDNKALRQAVAYAINREPIAKGVFLGLTEPTYQPFHPDSWAYSPNFKGFPYDPAKAKAKLAEGGKPEGFEVVMTTLGTEEYSPVIEAVQAQLKEIGIRAVPKLVDGPAFITAAQGGDFQMALATHPGQLDPDIAYGQFHTKGGMNNSRYSNPKVDELLERARLAFDNKERKRYYDEAIPIATDDVGTLILFFRPVLVASTSKVQNYRLMPGWQHAFEGLKNVWLKR